MIETLSIQLKRLGHYAVYRSIALPLGILFVILVLTISPVGEFPLNDDWIYTKTVQHLLETGQYRAHPYINATLVAQSYWGALFCKIFGFSFTILRVSTLVLAFANAWAVAKSGIVLGFSRNLALLCGAVVATSPLVLQLSYSFMSDVPFLALSNLSGLCFLKALRQPKPQWVAWGSIAAALAFLVRQFGILLPVAFAIAIALLVWRKRYAPSKSTIAALLLPWIAVAGIYVVWGDALASDTPLLETSQSLAGPLLDSARHIPLALCYVGLFALPLGVGRLIQIVQKQECWTPRQRTLWIGFCGVSLFVFWLPQLLYWIAKLAFGREALWLRRYPYRMPLTLYKSLLDLGLGPLQLPDPQFQPTVQIREWWWPITLAALCVAGLLFVSVVNRYRQQQDSEQTQSLERQNQDLFLLVWALLSLAATYNPFRAVMVDRYLLVPLVPFILLLGRDLMQVEAKVSFKPMAISALAIALFSVGSLQEYLAWNQTAWIAHHRLETKYRVSSQAVAGIDTFNGWFNSEAYMQRYNTRSWWDVGKRGGSPWALDDQYAIASVEPRAGYEVLERIPYFSWLGMKQRSIAIFKRSSFNPPTLGQPRSG
ncbi:ArnT family glycosyltransferase [Altericista sp. CCNU0014]|uniref:ArnT family glycosyltransferase n=1 Tax=Altericista sp. CCNU0014 TaxID=3082949 RepID=UPI00384BB08A